MTRQNLIFLIGMILLASAWFDLRNTMLVNRGVGIDIRAMIEERTSDRWTKGQHDAWARDIEKRLTALEKKQ